MSRPKETSFNPGFFFLWVLAGFLELPLLIFSLGGELVVSGPIAAVLHLCAAAAMAVAGHGGGKLEFKTHWSEPLALWTLLLPGWGWLGAGALLAANPAACASGARYEFDESSQENDEPENLPVALPGADEGSEQKFLEAVDLVPAADVLLGQDQTLKRGAIEALVKIRTPEAIGWLLKARSDPNAEVRFYATSALTNLKREYETNLRAAELEIFERPSEILPQLAYCRISRDFALSGLLDTNAGDELLTKAVKWLSGGAANDEQCLRLLFEIEKSRDPARALPLLERLKNRIPGERLSWLKEEVILLFALGRYKETSEKVLRLEKESEFRPQESVEWESSLLWWRSHG